MSNLSNERMLATVGSGAAQGITTILSTTMDGMITSPLPGYSKPAMVKAEHTAASPHLVDYVNINPDRTPASTIFTATATQVEFRLRGGAFFKLSHPALSVVIAETGGTNSVTMCKAYDAIDTMEIAVDGGSTKVQTMTGREMYQNTQWLTQERWSTIAPSTGTTSSWGAPTALAANGSKLITLPILGSWFDQTQPFMRAVKSDIVIRFNFRNAVSAGTGVLSSSALQMIFDQDNGTAQDSKQIAEMYTKHIGYNFFFNTQYVNATAVFTANVPTTISLRQVTGKAVFMTFALRSTNAPASEGYSTFTAIEPTSGNGGVIAFQNPQQTNILGGAPLQAAKLRYIDYVKHTNSQFSQSNAVYLIPFSDNARESFTKCSLVNGMYYFSGSEDSLVITPHSAFSSGTYYYDILIYVVNSCALDDGKFKCRVA